MAKNSTQKTSTTTKKSSTSEAKARIRKLTMVELEQVVGGTAKGETANYVTYSRFEGNSGRWGSTC